MATCSAGLRSRSWSKESCSYSFVAPKKWSLRKTVKHSAYCDHAASFLPRMYMDQSLRNLRSIPQAHSWGFTTNWSWKHTMSHVASCDTNHERYYKLLLHFFRAFSQKQITCQRPIKNPCYKLLFRFFGWISPAYKARLLRFASARRHGGL